MVDLVKLRKKAKEKQEERASSNGGQVSVAEVPVTPAEEPAREEQFAPAPPPPPKKTRNEAKDEQRAPGTPKRGAKSEPPPPAAEESAGAAPAVEEPAALGAPNDRLEEFKRSAGTRQTSQGIGADLRGDENLIELLTFVIGREQYAISIEKIVEIIPPQNATRVPNAPPSVVGIISLRGTIVTILDLRRRLGHAAGARGIDSRIIVVENKGETAGFVVDRVLRVIKTDPAKIESHPVVSPTEQSDHILGVFQHGKSLSIYLDLERLLQD